ncbi:proline dehydrogenase family protein [Candidatus Nitrosotenuis chungbukensis]|uniref:proline dehydrogenase family protein n=1 Tax=Candidatus Nitrosotenuis chungbukensis TaxID=1353246 RepID=UPI000AFC11AC|nr:proline dehydrogenase family protein [Candidatus Nitrosotenuis chungbukensis]WKT58632.1 proline dehydrogenase family protein [Candidatus Nitrosotenuis chungbukensis]
MVSSTQIMEKVLFGFAKQWIAGNNIDDALSAAQVSYKNGMGVIINRLGEYHTSKQIIEKTIDEYKTIMSSFKKWKVNGGISVKPTQIGLSRSIRECLQNFEILIKNATSSQTFVWIDMESSDHTDETIEIYQNLFSKYERLGMALQANLMRTENDLVDLMTMGAKIRLVKGAYRENSKTAYKSRDRINQNYLKLMKLLFRDSNEFGIATHDSVMIENAVSLSKKYERKFEFQMLRGIRDELKPKLVKNGFNVSEYVPYGTNWLPYSIRRLKERKRNILLLGSSFIQSHKHA